ncbi:MAG: ParB/RepB/Spo0J family partition protein [Burkholderiales bacterium]|nr:ParB/RepB/Spo0J family partition protein [Burkholderiales bacterium]
MVEAIVKKELSGEKSSREAANSSSSSLRGRPVSQKKDSSKRKTSSSQRKSASTSPKNTERFLDIEIEKLVPDGNQPRKKFDEDEIKKLAKNIEVSGRITTPILVLPFKGGKYKIVDGERRYRAAREAGFEKLPCIIIEGLSERDIVSTQLSSNSFRQDLTLWERVNAYRREVDVLKSQKVANAQKVVAEEHSIREEQLSDFLWILEAPDFVKQAVEKELIEDVGAARILANLYKDHPEEVERLVADFLAKNKKGKISRGSAKSIQGKIKELVEDNAKPNSNASATETSAEGARNPKTSTNSEKAELNESSQFEMTSQNVDERDNSSRSPAVLATSMEKNIQEYPIPEAELNSTHGSHSDEKQDKESVVESNNKQDSSSPHLVEEEAQEEPSSLVSAEPAVVCKYGDEEYRLYFAQIPEDVLVTVESKEGSSRKLPISKLVPMGIDLRIEEES